MEQEVHRLVEVDLVSAEEPDAARPADARERRLHHRGVELGRIVPLEAEQDRAVGAMAEASERKRAVELNENLAGPLEQALGLEVEHE